MLQGEKLYIEMNFALGIENLGNVCRHYTTDTYDVCTNNDTAEVLKKVKKHLLFLSGSQELQRGVLLHFLFASRYCATAPWYGSGPCSATEEKQLFTSRQKK
jgi:hypothetical protein